MYGIELPYKFLTFIVVGLRPGIYYYIHRIVSFRPSEECLSAIAPGATILQPRRCGGLDDGDGNAAGHCCAV